jgi:hypothetical protein
MGRRASEKTIHGQPVSQTVFLNTIVEALGGMGGGRAGDLVEVLGSEWETTEAKQVLNQTLLNLSRRGTLRRIEGERGLYEVTTHGRRAGVSVFDRLEKDILDVIRSHGGFCRMRDILDAFGVRPVGPDRQDMQNDPVYTRVLQVIGKSEMIRQDHIVRGVYNLPIAETESLPLCGRWAAMIIEAGCGVVKGGKLDDEVWREERDLFFSNVGGTFKALREIRGLTAAQVLDDPAIHTACCELQRRAPKEVAIIRSAWMDRIEIERRRMAAADKPIDEINAYIDEETERLTPTMPRSLYSRFEKGALGAHFHAPLALYEAVAKFYGVRASALSRGVISPEPAEERLRPAQTNYLDYGAFQGAAAE